MLIWTTLDSGRMTASVVGGKPRPVVARPDALTIRLVSDDGQEIAGAIVPLSIEESAAIDEVLKSVLERGRAQIERAVHEADGG